MKCTRDQLMGCWLGKAVGGTFGQSFEGLSGPLDATFYRPVPTEMVPNDDLDLQVVWACVLSEMEHPVVDASVLADAWLRYVEFPFNEYGVAKRNLREGLRPPMTGSYDNWFTCGEGAAIRSELWACLAPGDPQRAARYAAVDASVDHAGDGIHAAMFLAALESALFASANLDGALDAGLNAIPSGSGISRAVRATRTWLSHGLPWLEVRKRILAEFGVEDFTDVRMNTGFVVLGLLAGEGDFERSILITNNCGRDTDSTTASVGAALGIRDPDSIPPRWLNPIGRDLVLSPGIVGLPAPRTLDELTDVVQELAARLDAERTEPAADSPTDPGTERGIEVASAFFTMTDEHHNLNTWFLPAPGSPAPGWPSSPRTLRLPGTWARLAADGFEDDLLMLAYPVRLADDRRARIMVAATAPCRVWLDGRWLFGRDGGPMFPTPHMPPLNTYADLDLSAGDHEVRIVIRRPPDGEWADWVVAVADAATKEWIPFALRDTAVRSR